MTIKELPFEVTGIDKNSPDWGAISAALEERKVAAELFAREKYTEALRTIVAALRRLREAEDYTSIHFRGMLATLLFDLSEVHFAMKDFKQSEKELDLLFKVLENLLKEDADRFGRFHVLAMELSTRILRSRRKTLELLAKQQINTGKLYEKVNSGVAAATDKLVESLRKGAEMLASTGDYHAAVKFYAEAIKIAKKRSGRITRREVKMTMDMAAVMMRSKSEAPRAERLLNAILPHAISLELVEFEQEILAMLKSIGENIAHEPAWRQFMEKVQLNVRNRFRKREETADEKAEKEEAHKAEKKAKEEKKAEKKARKEAEKAEKEARKEEKRLKKEAEKAEKERRESEKAEKRAVKAEEALKADAEKIVK